jgi:hypothetical protein
LIRREPVFHRYGVFKVRAVFQNSTVFSAPRSTFFQASRRTGRELESPHRRVRRLPE